MKLAKLLSLAALLPLSACGGAGDGSLRVFWAIGGAACKDVPSIKSVRVRVLDGDVDVVRPVDSACEQGQASRGLVIEGVPEGSWDVLVQGMNAEGKPWYEGRKDGVGVDADAETEVQITLALLPSTVHVTWYFANGKMCAAPENQVAGMEVGIYDSVTFAVLYPKPAPKAEPIQCQDGEVLAEGVDGNREVNVNVFGLDAQGKRKVYGKVKALTVPGARVEAEVQLKPCTVEECQ